MIVRSSSTLRETSLARHIDYVKRVLEKDTHDGRSDALKNLNQEENHRRENRIEVESRRAICGRGSVILSTSLHSPTREERKAMTTATSWRRNHHCHRPLHDPGDEPGDPSYTETQRQRPSNRRAVACVSYASTNTTHAVGLGAGATTEAPEAATQCYG